jgi:photosystem II stability/assembly factor-like uncharacterized protein
MNTKSHEYTLKNKRYMSKKYLLLIAIIAFSLNDSFAQWNNSGPEFGLGKIRQNNSRLYMLGTRLYHSDDNGDTWTLENTPAVTFNEMFFLPNKIMAATTKGIFISNDNGISWISNNTGITDSTNGVRDIKQLGTRLIATSSGAIYYSDNYGTSWIVSNITGGNVRQIVFINNTILVCAFGGVYRSIDNGLTYVYSNSGINGSSPNILNIYNYNGEVFCHKSNSIEVYKSANEGLTWTLNNTGLTGSIASNFSLVNNSLFLTTTSGLFQLSGNNWAISAIDNGSKPILYYYINNTYLANVFSQSLKLVKSINNGSSWIEVTENPKMFSINKLIVTINNNLFGISNTYGVFLFNEIDSSWSRFTPQSFNFGGTVTNGSAGDVYSIIYSAGNQYYIATDGGVWSSNDNGVNWTQHHVGLPITNVPSNYKTVKDLYINGNAIVAATTGGIYRSTDQANTWTQVSTLACNDLQKYGSYLYATGNGVFRSNDNGLTWTAFAGATSGGPFTYITGAGGKLFTSTDASQTPGNTIYADTLATSFSSLTTNIGGAYGYGDFLFLSKFYINTALSLTNLVDMTDNLPCYYASQALGCIETYLTQNTVFGDNLWLGTSGFSTWYRSLGDFGFPVTATNIENEDKEILLYPNPTSNNFTIQNATANSVLNIFNLQGSKVIHKKLTQDIDNISIEQLSNGIYFYHVTDSHGIILGQGKVIKN